MPLALLFLLAFQDEPAFRTEVKLVHVDVEVRHKERQVEGLTKDDFRVTDNGKIQPVLYLAHQEEALDIVLLLDVSISMRPVIERIADATTQALAQLREGDRVAVMAFDTEPDLVADFTTDPAAVERAIREQVLTRRFNGGTMIQRAVNFAALHFLKEPRGERPRRRAALIVTDNLSFGREGDALPNLWEADAVLSGLIVRDAAMVARFAVFYPPGALGIGGMSGLADKTGGDTIGLGKNDEGLREMIQRLRLRYSLYYAMPEAKPSQERKVKVDLTGTAARTYRGASIRARRGYETR